MGNGSISGCCNPKPVPVNIAAATLQNIEVKKKETPNGYAKLFPGQVDRLISIYFLF